MSEPYEVRRIPRPVHWRYAARWVLGAAFGGFLLIGSVLGLVTQDLDSNQRMSAVVAAGVGALLLFVGGLAVAGLPKVLSRAAILRLDASGIGVAQGTISPPLEDGPEPVWTLHVPWAQIASVSLTRLSPEDSLRLTYPSAVECLRFTLLDDRSIVLPSYPPDQVLRTKAMHLGLTPAQARLTLVLTPGRLDRPPVLDWLRAHRPHLPVLEGTSLPWSTPPDRDKESDRPRVAVVGAHGRLGRLVVARLVADADGGGAAPVALVRNEGHRRVLEEQGAEVRMYDVSGQGATALSWALRGCSAVVLVARGSDERPHEVEHDGVVRAIRAATMAGVDRLVLVVGARSVAPDVLGGAPHDVVGHLASSGLAWTALRPASLTDGPARGSAAVGEDQPPGAISRADLADVVVAALRDDGAARGDFGVAGSTADPPPGPSPAP